MGKTFRGYLDARKSSLDLERQSWVSHWRDLQDYILPRRGRFLTTDNNKGNKLNDKIIDNTPTMAARTLSSGMMAGLTSPARPWFRLATPDPDMMEYGPIKDYLEQVEYRMNMIFAKSNLYNSFPMVYDELGVFGTAPLMVEEDFRKVIRTSTFTAGEYMIAQSDKGVVDTFRRDFRATVLQCVSWFGLDNVSRTIKDQYDRGNYDHWVDIGHMIEPNDGRIDLGLVNKRPYRGVYYEMSSGFNENPDDMLETKGFNEFPIMCPRWHLMSESDIYGRSPAMDALGDSKQLQKMQERKLEALDKWVRPPMAAPAGMKGKKSSIIAGDITYIPRGEEGQFAPALNVRPEIQYITMDIQETQHRIERAFFADLFLMMTNLDRRQITAREVQERHEEKLLMLGPVLERLNDELLDPLIDRTFNIMQRNNLLPEAPEELNEVELDIQYVSILAQAQQSVSTSGVDRLVGFVGSIAQFKPEALDKLDEDEAIDKYANMLGTPASIIRSDDDVAGIRESRAQQQQQAMRMEQAQAAAQTAKTASEVDVSEGSALGQIVGAY